MNGLGVCAIDVFEARRDRVKYENDFCQIMMNRPRPAGLPAYIQPPRNSTRWTPFGSLVIPVAPAGADQLVLAADMPLGYDGILIAITNTWNGTGFVEAAGDITWRIKKDRVFIPFFDSIVTTRGTLSVPFDVVGQGIPLLSGQRLQYYANFQAGSEGRLNLGGLTLCAFTGYIWPRERIN